MALSEKYVDRPPGQPVETMVERPAATPAKWGNTAPLALCAFALTTFVLSTVNAGLVDKTVEPMVFGVALTFGGLTQFVAGLLQFRIGNTFGGVLFTGFGAFWLSLWAFATFFIGEIPAAEVGNALGLFLLAWGIFAVGMWLVSFRTNVVVNVALLVLAVTFFALSAGAYAGSTGLTRTGGYLGVIVAAMAFYIALAELMEANYERPILPLWPLGKH
jgi:succinate-acetate transporter protein